MRTTVLVTVTRLVTPTEGPVQYFADGHVYTRRIMQHVCAMSLNRCFLLSAPLGCWYVHTWQQKAGCSTFTASKVVMHEATPVDSYSS